MPQVVRAELHLEPVSGRAARDRHHAGVVDQHVEPAVRCGKRFSEAADGRQAGEIQGHHFQVGIRQRGTNIRSSLLAFRRVAHSQRHGRALPGQHLGCLEPQPTVSAGDQRGLTGLRGDVLLDPTIEIGHLHPSSVEYSLVRVFLGHNYAIEQSLTHTVRKRARRGVRFCVGDVALKSAGKHPPRSKCLPEAVTVCYNLTERPAETIEGDLTMKTLTVPYPQDFELAVSTTAEELEAQARLMAALKMFELGKLSSGKAAELAGMSRVSSSSRCVAGTGCQSSIMTRKILKASSKATWRPSAGYNHERGVEYRPTDRAGQDRSPVGVQVGSQ